MSEQVKSELDFWGVVELFGHQRIAGHVSQYSSAGVNFIRVDVPERSGNRPAFTKFYGPSAIYAMTPCEESIARLAAEKAYDPPIAPFVVAMPSREAQQMLIPETQDDIED